jgi:hypothetical protein
LPYGWIRAWYEEPIGGSSRQRNLPGLIVPADIYFYSDITFPTVDANLITDSLSIRIVSIDGLSPESAAKQKRISTLSANDYNRIPSILANGMDIGNINRYILNKSHYEVEVKAYGGFKPDIIFPYGISNIKESYILHTDHIPRNHPEITSITFPPTLFFINELYFDDDELTKITIGANVYFYRPYKPESFIKFYDQNGKRAGTYTRSEDKKTWTFTPK